VGPKGRSGRGSEEKNFPAPARNNPVRPVRSLVTTLTELSELLRLCVCTGIYK